MFQIVCETSGQIKTSHITSWTEALFVMSELTGYGLNHG